ncbi:uncharacterized protein BDZ99DRAFT_478212 [Mytilinidion resinicola]|uniref:Uncharacterized protein n=1 Tax=Mytilinidion resinicola TaxID=574789 RepID=A0A6A6YGK1_9PEZI|nr:uncharacterized protein BDZ99DRAFT_478212 [Mytilinidion resinicola]KAF2807663.1 hypothetical protein BDZ99DRAFT_478212 [Mytilinidion resinicola]
MQSSERDKTFFVNKAKQIGLIAADAEAGDIKTEYFRIEEVSYNRFLYIEDEDNTGNFVERKVEFATIVDEPSDHELYNNDDDDNPLRHRHYRNYRVCAVSESSAWAYPAES